MDNGPELIAQELLDWCERNHVDPRHIQPGKPNQNAYVERYNRSFRNEILDAYVFESLDQVRQISAEWLRCTTKKGLMTRSEDSLRPSSERL